MDVLDTPLVRSGRRRRLYSGQRARDRRRCHLLEFVRSQAQIIVFDQSVPGFNMVQEFHDLGLSFSLLEFVNANNVFVDESFMEVVKACVKGDKLILFGGLMVMAYIQRRYLCKAKVLQQVIDQVTSANRIEWLKVVVFTSCPTLCVNEKLMAIWTRKKYDLVERCLTFYLLPRLSLEYATAYIILTDALQENASDDLLDSVIVITKSTDFLLCVLHMLDVQQSKPAVKNFVDRMFLHFNILGMTEQQLRLLSKCFTREVVLGKMLLEATLKGSVSQMPLLLQTLDKMYCGVLDLEVLAPLFSSTACNTHDVVILLIRTGLLHQYGTWIRTRLEECRCKARLRCKCCNASYYLVHPSVPDGPAIQQLLLQSGFLPNRLLFKLPQVFRPEVQPEEFDVRTPPLPHTSTSTFPQEMESVVNAFVQQPYSLLTMAAAKVSTMIGCHSGRTECIGKLPVPKLLQDHVAFRAGDFKLTCEKEEEFTEAQRTAMTVEVEVDVGDGGGHLRLSAAGEAAVEIEMGVGRRKRRRSE